LPKAQTFIALCPQAMPFPHPRLGKPAQTAAIPISRHGKILRKAANTAQITQSIDFQRNNRTKDTRYNDLFFRDLKTSKKGLM